MSLTALSSFKKTSLENPASPLGESLPEGKKSEADLAPGQKSIWGISTFSKSRSLEVQQADPKGILKSENLNPGLKKKVEELIHQASAQGLKPYLFEGYRSPEEQKKLVENGVSKAGPGQSFHNYGLAVDVIFRDEKGRPSWNEKYDWKKLGAIGKSVGLEWGGDWKSIVDRPHFQMPDLSLSKVQKNFKEGGFQKVWDSVAATPATTSKTN